MIFPKVGVGRFTGPQGQSDVRYEITFEPILIALERRQRFFVYVVVLLVGCYGKRHETTNLNLNINLCLEYQSE